ncbi:MAG: N-acetyltransferase [Clostridium sp.]|nr:N-acetyltransferase [Bacteroides sp.]MCM1199274.1 N-acetyltransferase [Clostridium sp.]
MKREITHSPDRHLFTITEDGFVANVEYAVKDGVFDIIHTYVPDEIGGRGIAGELVEAAYSFAESQGLKLRGSCTYASYWLLRHQK